MIADLKPYPEYKDSGLPWLGEVPAHWEVGRLKRLLRPVDHRSTAGTETLLSLRRDHGVVVYADHFSRPPQGATTVGFKLVRAGQLVVNRLQANNGLVFHSSLDGLVSPDYSVFDPKGPLLVEYLSELLRTPSYRAHFRRECTGLGTGSAGFLRLYDDRLLGTIVALPTLSEQSAIMRFLGWAGGRLERAIRAKRKVIALLNEQKQAIIHSAVTRGLDPSIPLKPSGIPWLGDIPQHWETPLNQRVFGEKIRPQGGSSETQLSLSQRDGLIATRDMQERSLQTASFDNWKVTIPGDLVLNRFKAHLGVFFSTTIRGIVSYHYGVFEPKLLIDTKYFELLFHTYPYRAIFAGKSNGMTIGLQNLSNQNFYDVRCILPPISEQFTIVSETERETKALGAIIRGFETEICLLREYRTRLVSEILDVVGRGYFNPKGLTLSLCRSIMREPRMTGL